MPALFAISPGEGEPDRLRRRLPGLARGGVGDFLLREKQASAARRRRWARELAPCCRDWGLRLWISDDAALAREVGAHGVHLGEAAGEPPPELPSGLSLHRGSPRPEAQRAGARHLFLGPVFDTPSKRGIVEPIGPAAFLQERAALPGAACYALGGIGLERLGELAALGIRSVAGIRLFFGPEDPEELARECVARLSELSSCP